MRRLHQAIAFACVLSSVLSALPAQAGPREDCKQQANPDLSIRVCTDLIRRTPNDHTLYNARGNAYAKKRDFGKAIADYSKAIRLSPRNAVLYFNRGDTYQVMGEYDRAILDFNESLRLDPRDAGVYNTRGNAYAKKRDFSKAIADYSEAIRLSPHAVYYFNRGDTYFAMQDYGRALADLGESLRLDPRDAGVYVTRGVAYQAKGEKQKAIDDYTKALSLPASHQWDRDYQAKARRLLTALGVVPPPVDTQEPKLAAPTLKLTDVGSTLSPPRVDWGPPPSKLASPPSKLTPQVAPLPSPPPSTHLGRRVALAIGNAAYRKVDPLPNPKRDASDIAAALKAAGFAEVVVLHDLGLKEMQRALAAFEAKAAGAAWAVVYYGGHAIQVDGKNFLVPVDAELKSPSDVEDETLVLDRVLARIAAAAKLRLVILDACRTNPFRRLWATAKPAAGAQVVARDIAERGLRRYETTQRNLLIAYAAAEGQAALDGPSGGNSPYVKALLKHLATPGLEIDKLFRLVGDDVTQETGGKQQPFQYGSRSGEDLFFRAASR
jgi:Flp pilus assembly protein TadD